MSIFGTGTSDFAPLSGEDNESYSVFGDIEVGGNIYLKDQTNTLTGYNVPLITADKTTDDLIFNTTSLNNNFNFTVGTGQDLKETIFAINPTTGLAFNVHTNTFNIGWDELSYLNGARENIQVQIDNLSPDMSSNQGYWGTVWCLNDLSNNIPGTPNLVSYTNIDASSNGVVYNNSTHVQVENEGIYMFIMTAQMYVPSANTETVYFWIKKNGITVPDTAFKEELKNATKLICANWQLPLKANDYIEIAWQSTDTNMKIEHFQATGNIPAIPSIILTVSQITYFQSVEADVNGILQRITGINYNSTNDTTIITNDLSCNSVRTGGIIATDISGNSINIANTLIANKTTGIITFHASAYIDLESSIFAHNTYISPENISYVSGTTSNIQTQLNNKVDLSTAQTILARKWFNNGIDVSGTLFTSIGGVQQNIISYIDTQFTNAYNHATDAYNKGAYAQHVAEDALNAANAAQSTANDAVSTANNAKNTADGAMALASGASAGVAGLAVVVSSHTAQLSALEAGAVIMGGNITELQAKTENLNSVAGVSTFTGQVVVGDITMNEATGIIFCNELDVATSITTPAITGGTLSVSNSVQNYLGTTVNIGKSTGGSAINIATDGVNTISIGSLSTALTTYICGVPYSPFFPTGFGAQW